MPYLPDKIKQLLTNYDQRKFISRVLYPDPPVIKALQKLTLVDQNNIFKVYQCFIDNPSNQLEALSELIGYISKKQSLDNIINLLNFLINENLTTQNISKLVCEYCQYDYFFPSLKYLKNSRLLTQENLDAIANSRSPSVVFSVLKKLSEILHFGPLSQALLDSLKLSPSPRLMFLFAILHLFFTADFINSQNLIRLLQLPNDSFLLTNDAHLIIWNRIPSHLFTEAVLDQLMTLSQQENPQQPIEQYVNQLLGRNREIVINDAQSTHHASVHQSVSDSASKLFKRYSLMIEGNRLQDTLQMIHDYIMQLPEGSIKNTAAKNCVERIIHLTFTDPGSNLTISQLLALSFLALNDTVKRIGDLSDAKEQFVEGLYEIQRGYNLSEQGHDDGSDDKPICISGTFNKLIEKLEGIHPDVKVLHITHATASLKLPIVVREVALDYLASLAKPQTLEGLRRFMQLIEQIRQDECVEAIWDHLKAKIVDRMFAEFGSLYTGKADPQLNALIKGGQYLKLENLSRFQEQITASSGYQRYYSQILRSHSNFFSPQTATNSDFNCSLQSPDTSRRFGS